MTDHAVNEWTRDDLPDGRLLWNWSSLRMDEIHGLLDAVVDHLNDNHPKPPRGGHDAQIDQLVRMCNEADLKRTRAERERDEALRKKGEAFDRAVRAERARDWWKARAESAERELAEEKRQHSDTIRVTGEQYAALQRERDEWKARAEQAERAAGHLRKILNTQKGRVADVEKKHPAPAVSRADIEKAISELRTFPRFLTDELLVLRDEAIDAAWALVSSVEAEPADPAVAREDDPTPEDIDERLLWLLRRAGDEWGPLGVARTAAKLVEVAEAEAVDPAEEKARELYALAHPGVFVPKGDDAELVPFRRIAAHVLGQETGDE